MQMGGMARFAYAHQPLLLSRRKQHEFKIPISEILFTCIPRVVAKPIELDPNPRDPGGERNYEDPRPDRVGAMGDKRDEFAESNGIWCSVSYHFRLKFPMLIAHLSINTLTVMKV
ncbi:hypothetical protein PUN28_017179 [Cardiocondyla obscurior]|uniref:Uncharacterized protein n=1 Tax=Cardiocondyla obscurior TaxID=286306 RepID=A0AAW2EPG4_9HYME